MSSDPNTRSEAIADGSAHAPAAGEAVPGPPDGAAIPAPPADHAPADHAASPFANEAAVMGQGVPMRDDVSETQEHPGATRDISAAHLGRLLYRPIAESGGPVYEAQRLERMLRPPEP